jgi:predicted RND superfamily exporter protein
MLERFARWVLRFRLAIIAAAVLLTGLSILALFAKARVESDISKYLPADDPVIQRFTRAGEKYGGVTVALVVVDFGDVFDARALSELASLTRALQEIDGIKWVISLTNVDDVQESQIEGEKAVLVGKLIQAGKIPSTAEELDRLRRYVLGKETLTGTVVSADGRYASVACTILEKADRVVVAAEIERVARAEIAARPLYFSGFPNWTKTMSQIILSDMARLVPIVALLVILVLLASFRSLRGVLLPLLNVILSSTWAMGLMSALDWPITMLSNAVPVLMMALGTAYSIHLLHRVNESYLPASPQGSIERTLSDVFVPILGAGVTTVAGFLSFLTTDLSFIRQTGWIAAFGIFVAMALALTLLPAILSLLPPPKPRARSDANGRAGLFLTRTFDGIVAEVLRRPKAAVAVASVLAVATIPFILRIESRFDMVEYFPVDSDVRIADRLMREKLGGNTPVWITVAGDARDPLVLRHALLAGKFLRAQGDIQDVRSIAELLAEMNQVMSGRRSLPDSREGVANLWLSLEGKDILDQLVDGERRELLVQGRCRTGDTGRLRRLVAETNRFLSGFPRRFVPVRLPAADAETAQKAGEVTRRWVAFALAMDIQARLSRQTAPEEILRWLDESDHGIRAKAGELRKKIGEYLASPEAELEIPEERQGAAADEAARLLSGAANPESLSAALGARIFASQADAEENAPDLMALSRSLLILAREERGRARVAALAEALARRLGPEASGHRALRTDIEGDLWELEAETAWLPEEEAPPRSEKPVEASLAQTGFHEVTVEVDDGIVRSQLSSLGLAILVAFVFIAFQFRSLVAALLGLIPVGFTLAVIFAVMGALDIKLEPATVLIASVVVGVGIDYPIHLLSRIRLEGRRSGTGASAAILQSVHSVGRAILINAMAVLLGMLVFLFAQLIPLHYFGSLMALAMATSSLTAIIVLPAALAVARSQFLRRICSAADPDAGVPARGG